MFSLIAAAVGSVISRPAAAFMLLLVPLLMNMLSEAFLVSVLIESE